MGELRKDYFQDNWVILVPARGKRPNDFAQPPLPPSPANSCFFCPGHEDQTPPEIGKLGHPWYMRWFKNKFPAVELSTDPAILSEPFTKGGNYGVHEVIVETATHEQQLHDFQPERIAALLQIYVQRIHELSKDAHTEYVQVFKNHGAHAGTSIYHSHSQVVSLNFIPPFVRDLHFRIKQGHSLQSIAEQEQSSSRHIKSEKRAISFAPYAPRFNFEAWIVPSKISNTSELSQDDYLSMARCLKHILLGLAQLHASYNITFVYGPKNLPIHPHLRVLPRLTNWGGFEHASGTIITTMPPEQAADYYRSL